MATVLGLADEAVVYGPNSNRLHTFRNAWARAWPGLHIEHQPTFINHPALRGYGLAAGTFLAMTHALVYLRSHNATCDYHLMLEDDGLPFNGTSWPGQAGAAVNDLEVRLDALDAVGGVALILGGHDFMNMSRAAAAKAAAQPHGGIVAVGLASGSYGYIVKCSALADVVAHMHAHLRRVKSTSFFEQILWTAFQKAAPNKTAAYISAPLLVDHAPGFSATHHRKVPRPFQGNATFW